MQLDKKKKKIIVVKHLILGLSKFKPLREVVSRHKFGQPSVNELSLKDRFTEGSGQCDGWYIEVTHNN